MASKPPRSHSSTASRARDSPPFLTSEQASVSEVECTDMRSTSARSAPITTTGSLRARYGPPVPDTGGAPAREG
ncbi:hypothetical protein GCM10017673_29460 [Streptosporangium violaceochromogenes]|nr:hypothetical protein GCM10017673_29460 [Streptosporangium violaceochromogenes]